MSVTLRVILIVCSFISFFLCIKKIKQSKLKVANSVTWISQKLGFLAPVNFVFLVMIAFLLIQVFIDNIHITELNEKIKDLDHYIALKEHKDNNK